MNKPDRHGDEHLTFKLFFGLMEGSASGPKSVTAIAGLGFVVVLGRAIGLL